MTPALRKRLLIGAAGLIGLLIVALLVAPSLIDLDARKAEVIAAVKKATGRDLILAKGGGDRIKPRCGDDCVFGGRGPDRVFARGGGVDKITCGRGRDVAFVSGRDSTRGCERVRRGGRPKRR